MHRLVPFATLILMLSQTGHSTKTPSVCDLPKYCTAEQAIACIKSVQFNKTYYKSVVDDIISLLDPYVFTDILKNPPQPEGFTDYFKPIDLIANLRNVSNTTHECFYDFYRAITRVLTSAQDGHLTHLFVGNDDYNHKLFDFYAHLPMDLYTVSENNKPKMVARPTKDAYYEHFEKGDEIKRMVSKNVNIGIESINGQSPFDFVLGFGKEYYNFLKNRDAQYTYAQYYFSNILPLYHFPLEISDFKGIEIVYENGDNITTDFLFVNTDPVDEKDSARMPFARYVRSRARDIGARAAGRLDLVKLLKEWEKEADNNGSNNNEKKPLTEREILEQLQNMDIEKLAARRAKRSNTKDGWEYATEDEILKCRVDDANEVNVYFISSFYPGDAEDFAAVLTDCAEKFEDNTYPIIVIDDMNTGGSIALANFFQIMLQHNMVTRSYVAYKNDPKLRRAMEELNFFSSLEEAENCTTIGNANAMFANSEIDDYGNGVLHNRSAPVLITDYTTSYLRLTVEDMFKRDRKPTEIVVFTDSFSFSAGSIFTKGLKEAGSAIIVGYNGYPGSPKETFDIGQSPTNCLQEGIEYIDEGAYKRLSDNGVVFASVSIGESYRVRDVQQRKNATTTLVPREFLFDAPDERSTIYGSYNESRYNEFVQVAKSVIKKYKAQCNPANPRLHMHDPSCSGIINKTNMHGGFACGDDGKWTTTCEGYYCDVGFVYDAGTDSCIKDSCYDRASSLVSSITTIIIIAVVAFVVVIIIMGIVVFVCYFCVCDPSEPMESTFYTAGRYVEPIFINVDGI